MFWVSVKVILNYEHELGGVWKSLLEQNIGPKRNEVIGN